MLDRRNSVLLSVLLWLCASLVSSFVEELDDSFRETRGDDDIWLIKFYAPWCSFCKQLDPVWHQIGSELKSLGSPVNVGKSDATANTGLAEEFRVRGYPAIIMWKKNLKYVYSGKRTKEEIMEFTHRVSGPLVRSLNSLQLFQHAMSRHDVMFVYVGATSQLKVIALTSLPAVVLFKDGTYFTYSEERDGDLRSWINRERFPNFSKIDSYTLYAMGETGKLVSLVLVDEKNMCEKSVRYKVLMEKVASDHRDTFSRNFYFGFMEENDYINGLIMMDVIVPSFVVVNLSNDGYFLPQGTVDTERQLFDFLDGIRDGTIQCQGGNGVVQRGRRLIYDTKLLLTSLFDQAPLLGCFLLSFPFAIATVFCYLCCKARPTSSEDEDEDAPQRCKKLTNKKSD
nr:PREDICTED: protein disulfide-isomerase TMX3-like isoform X3 [Paralichthys olivaceus]